MRFRNSLHVIIDNFPLVFKVLLYNLVTGVLFFGVSYTIVTINLNSIVSSAEAQEIFSLLGKFFTALISGDTAFLQGFEDTFLAAAGDFMHMLSTRMGAIIWSIVGLCLLYLFSRFLNGLCTFTAGALVGDKMQTYSRGKFSSAFFANLGRAALYEVIYVPLSFLYTVLTVAVCWLLFFYALSFLPLLLTVVLAASAIVFLQTVKYTLISSWMPRILCGGEKVGAAFGASLKQGKGFWSRFALFLVFIYLIILMNVLGALGTLGSMLFISVPLSYLVLLGVQFVSYFEDSGRKYFIGYGKVAGGEEPPEVL